MKFNRLTKPAGEHKMSLSTDENFNGPYTYDPTTEAFTLTISANGVPRYEATIPANDLGWKASTTSFKWKAKTVMHPDGLKSVRVGGPGKPFKLSVKAADLDIDTIAAFPSLTVTLQIGNDAWSGPAPTCELSTSGATFNCRL
jgi:hypothetical protein